MPATHTRHFTVRHRLLPLLFATVCTFSLVAPRANAQSATYSVLHTFSALAADGHINSDGFNVNDLVQGTDGNFYGTSYYGGGNGTGTVFKITPAGTLTTLYNFSALIDDREDDQGYNSDGGHPAAALTLGSDGNFYGTTGYGSPNRVGTIFRITPAGILTTLHNFDARAANGTGPNAEGYDAHALTLGADGNFYGTNYRGGANGNGTVFKVTPAGALTILHTFSAGVDDGSDNQHNSDGVYPQDLVQGTDGNLYGTTFNGGTHSTGTIFRITPAGDFGVVHEFSAFDDPIRAYGPNPGGAFPAAGLTRGGDGNFYGTTLGGGTNGTGSVFKITPAGAFTSLHSFGVLDESTDTNSDGRTPEGRLTQASDDNFYGTTTDGGVNAAGTIFKITSAGEFTLLYSFSFLDGAADTGVGTNSDGGYSYATLLQGSDGGLYGTTFTGGVNTTGVVFKLAVPGVHAAFFHGEAALGNGAYYLSYPSGNPFGYYSYLADQNYVYHFDLGYEYVFDAGDGNSGIYFYDFKSNGFFYTSPTFPFPYLYDFTLNTVLYYYPDPSNSGHYNTDGYRFFYRFDNGQIIVK